MKRAAGPLLTATAVLAVAGLAAWTGGAASQGGAKPSFTSPQQASSETLPASAVRGVGKPPSPDTRVRVVARMPGAAGEELILASWRSADGWDCLGWAEDDEGHAALCSNADTKIEQNAVTFAGGGHQLDQAGVPLEQRLIGLVPQQASSVVAKTNRGSVRSPAFTGVDMGRGLHVFATVLPSDAGAVTIEARDSRDRAVAAKERSAPPSSR